MDEDMQFCIVIISEDANLENIEISVNKLKEKGCQKSDYIVAVKKEDNITAKEFCEENDINYFEYNEEKDVFFNLPETLNYDYISFINAGEIYTGNFREKLKKHFQRNSNTIFICPIKGNYILNKNLARVKKIDIEKNSDKIWIHLNSAFISKNILLKIKELHNDEIKYYTDLDLLIKAIALNGGYSIIRNVKLKSTKKMEDSPESKLESYDFLWYMNILKSFREVSEFSIKEYDCILSFIKYTYMYLLKNIINENVNSKNKHILLGEKLDKFYNNAKEILQNIDNEIIMQALGNKTVNYNLLKLKSGEKEEDIKYRQFNNKIYVVGENKSLFDAAETKIKVILMECIDDVLNMTAIYPFPFDEKKLKIYAEYLDEKIYAQKNYLYSDYKAFGRRIYKNYVFDIKIPLKEENEKKKIKFYLESDNTIVKLDLNFTKPLSKLSKEENFYWNCGKFILNYRKKSIQVIKSTKLRSLKRETKYIITLLRSKNEHAKKSGRLRLLYRITKNFYKKDIWLFEDKIYKGGDNGEYLYTYASKQKDGIKKYYILKEGCIDAKRFKKENKKYVKFASLRHKLLFLNSNIVFETHNNVTKQHSFDENSEKYFRDLFNSKNVCIQHGLTVQYIPDLTNRINDNLKQYFLASPVEEKNLGNKEYAYEGYKDILKITGCPRYDGLKSNDKKQILITPTWRNYLALPSVRYGESRRYNNNFKNSEYFMIYNNLINDEKLITTAKRCGYKIIYLLHPCTSSQIEDFNKNDSVELIAATDNLNYEKILTESSLMVTDYSGVQFDFAYMYKPIIYFHPNELPPSYEEGEYKYETMALGEITRDNKETVDLLCEYMENDCKIKEKYRKRIDKFFKYHDDNNCKRIYDQIMKYRKEN